MTSSEDAQRSDASDRTPEPQVLTSHEAFAAMLKLTSKAAPALVEALEAAHKLRGFRLFRLSSMDSVLQGLDELLVGLEEAETALSRDQRLVAVVQLAIRAKGDVETAIEALLGGRAAVLADAMRDCMEIELLVRDFAAEISRLEEWCSASDRVLRKEFSPEAVRNRLADTLGPNMELPDALEYRIHCQITHATPRDMKSGRHSHSLNTDSGAKLLSEYSFEILEHGRRLLAAMDLLFDAHDVPAAARPSRWYTRVRMRAGYESLASQHMAAVEGVVSKGFLPHRVPQERGTAGEWFRRLDGDA